MTSVCTEKNCPRFFKGVNDDFIIKLFPSHFKNFTTQTLFATKELLGLSEKVKDLNLHLGHKDQFWDEF